MGCQADPAGDETRGDSWHDRRDVAHPREGRPRREADQEGEGSMKETTQAKITASVAIAKAMAQKALAPNPNPQWTEYEMRSIDEWIARQGVKLDRPEAIRRLVEIGLRQKKESDDGGGSDSPRALGRNQD
jgi:hypothetical protein